jgi:hypothetical protein
MTIVVLSGTVIAPVYFVVAKVGGVLPSVV